MRLLASALVFVASLAAQGTAPKASVADYPSRAAHGDLEIGAEYMVRSILDGRQSYLARDFLVVEVAVFGPKGAYATLNAHRFRLRLNGKRSTVSPSTAGMVIASLRYEDWTLRPRAVGQIGIGDRDVTLGAPVPRERFPGDRRAPQPANSSNTSEAGPDPVIETVNRTALPDGKVKLPVSGYLFFPYTGKPEKLKKVELLLENDEGVIVSVLTLK